MQVAYELTEEDFTEAYAAHRNRNAFSRWTKRVFIWGTGLLSAFVLFGFLVKPNAQTAKGLLPFFGLVAVWTVILWLLPRWSMQRQFSRQPGAHGPRSLSLDSSGVHWRWNGGSSDVAWKNYVRTVEGKNQFLFYTSPACFNILPKRALGGEQLTEIRELLKQEIPDKD